MKGKIVKNLEARALPKRPAKSPFEHWWMQKDDDGVAWLYLDKKGEKTNTLSKAVLLELDKIIDKVDADPPKALVIRSAKPGGFCAGADIREFKDFAKSGTEGVLIKGHEVFDKLEALAIPTIAVIHGHCLGGGMEMALACQYRIGVKGSLQMGLPEIRLGLHPGLGGTYRLTGLIDPTEAMTMMLTGSSAFGSQTVKRGLVDALIEERHSEAAVRAAVEGKIEKQDQDFKDHALNSGAARKLTARKMRAMSEAKAPSAHYPAPYALIDLWEEHGGDPEKMQKAEIESFAKVMKSETAQNLIRVFFLQQGLKDLAKKGAEVRHVHVIGAGAMGGDIAGWCALQGLKVTLADMKTEPIAKAMKNAEALCRDKHKSRVETRDTLDRLIPDMKNLGVTRADLVIEAVPENPELKQRIYKAVEPKMKKGAILATNTSSIPLEVLAKGLKRPASFVGLHFFNPVSKMMVVEIVHHSKTGKQVMADALSFTGRISKLPVPVKSYPGFLVNRALTPYLLEAIVLLDEGVEKETIDKAALDFGMPMGPVELADQVGLDICLDVGEMLGQNLKKPVAAIPAWFRKKVKDGELGRKTGQGFYTWKEGRAEKKKDAKKPDPVIADRLILPMLDACVECYREKVITDLDHLDAAMIFATGFAPFRGGPMHYAKARGVKEIVKTLENLGKEQGERFKPDKGWKDL